MARTSTVVSPQRGGHPVLRRAVVPRLFGQTALACPSPGAPGTLLGYPACVYGFFMFLALAIVTGLGLRAGSRETVVDIEALGANRG